MRINILSQESTLFPSNVEQGNEQKDLVVSCKFMSEQQCRCQILSFPKQVRGTAAADTYITNIAKV